LPELVPQLLEKIEALGRAFARAERHGRGYPDPRAAQEQFRRLHALLQQQLDDVTARGELSAYLAHPDTQRMERRLRRLISSLDSALRAVGVCG
jgi:Ser/Thr protein kinase RdoA (MazF antagonist)